MADTILSYTADGSNNQFSITFDYISQSHVVVTVDGTVAPFTFFNTSTVQLNSTPSNNSTVVVKRVTPVTALVDFTDGTTLFEADLELSDKQSRFISEEAKDIAEGPSLVGLITSTGAEGSEASYNNITNVLTIPRGNTGPQGPAGADSTVAGPQGPQGPAGANSTVAGPQGPAGADSTVAGPQGPQGPVGADGADASPYTHPNHSGEVTSTGDGATVIASDVVDEANLKVSNSPTDGYVLTAQSGNTGGLTWSAASIPNLVASTGTATAPNDNVSIAIGGQAVASGTNSISLQRANSSGVDSIAAIVGNTTTSYGAQGGNTISIGALSKATAIAGTAVGYGATSTHSAASAFGTSATTTANSQVALGGSGYTVRISGAYNLPTSDGTNGQVLTSNGSGNLSWSTITSVGGSTGVTFNDNVKITLGDGTDGELYSDGSKVILESASSEFVNTDDGTVGPQFYLNHSTASPATTDYNGLFGFKTTDLGNNEVTPFYISAHTPDVTSGAATGQAKFLVKDDGLSYPIEYFRIDGDAENVGTFKPIKFYEDESNGNQGVVLQGPSSIGGSDVTFTLPSADGSSGQFLKTDGSGNLSFAAGGSIGGNTGVDFNDNVKARFGNSNDLEIYHSGSASIINDVGNGPLHIKGSTSVDFFGSNGEYMAYMVENGAVGLYHDGSQKLNTTSSGIQTTGTVNVNNAYTLPTADGSANQVLTTDGSGAVTFADAGGGGGADLYIANPVSATDPTAAGDNAVGIGDGADATGNDSIAIGTGTIAGLDSVAIGRNAASGTTTGSYNTSIGRSAAVYLTTGSNNTAVGRSALQGSNLDKVTGSDNTAVGYGAGSKNYSGNNNTYLGKDAGNAITSGSSNTFIGYNADGAATTSQQTALGYQAQTAGTEAIAIGNSRAGGIGTFAAQIGTNSSSYGAIGNSGTAIGGLTKTTGLDFVFGRSSIASGGSGSLSLGMDNTSSGAGSVTLGKDNTASHTDAVVIGQGASSSAADEITLGHTDQTVRISSAYTLPQADGTNGQVLTTDGSGAVTFADAGGGGGDPDLYSDNYDGSSTKPNASGSNSVALGKSAVSGGGSSIAFGALASSAGNLSSAIGFNAAVGSSGAYAAAIGQAYASGADSFAAAISTNSSSYGATNTGSIAMGNINKAAGYESFVAGGYANAANNYRSFVIGGTGNTVSTNYGAILGGEGNTVNSSSNYGVILNGEYNEINRAYTVASGKRAKTTVDGQVAHSAGHFASAGDAQGSKFILRATTTDATATALTTTLSTASAYNQIVAASDTCITFDGTITAMQNGAQAYASWRIEGLLVNDGGTTTLANSATTVIQNASNWGMALSADNTNNALAITFTGEASHNIRVVANIRTSEVTYA